jgi:hypothetical protein
VVGLAKPIQAFQSGAVGTRSHAAFAECQITERPFPGIARRRATWSNGHRRFATELERSGRWISDQIRQQQIDEGLQFVASQRGVLSNLRN